MASRPGPARRARPDDVPRIVEALAEAFDADPFFRWMFGPDPAAARRGTRARRELVVGLALARGEGWLVDGPAGPLAAAIWLPPGVELVGPEEVVAAARLLDELVGDRADDVLAAIGMSGRPVPDEPHWLCLYIGVRPAEQGRGLGRALMEPGIAAADRDGAPAHLVSTNGATASFYEQFGFRVLAEVEPAPGVPVLRPMWREPSGANERP